MSYSLIVFIFISLYVNDLVAELRPPIVPKHLSIIIIIHGYVRRSIASSTLIIIINDKSCFN